MGLAIGAAVWLLAQIDAAALDSPNPAPPSVVTPWPADLPCAHPRTIWFAGRTEGTFFGRPDGPLAWSSADGAQTLSFALAKERSRHRLRGDFPVGRLDRLAGLPVDANLAGDVFGVECAGGASITWGPCTAGVCTVSATYPARPMPKSKQRTRHWTDEIPGSPWTDVAPDVHWTRFHRDVALKKAGDPGAAREALRFTRALAIEVRDALAAACVRNRCTAVADEAASVLAAYLSDRAPAHENGAERRVDNWNYAWTWTATGGGVSLRMSCDDMTESPDLLCDLSVDLPRSDMTLEYRTFDRRIEVYPAADREHKDPAGRISGAADDGPRPTIFVEGRLLTVRGVDR